MRAIVVRHGHSRGEAPRPAVGRSAGVRVRQQHPLPRRSPCPLHPPRRRAAASLALLLTGCTGSATDSVDRARERGTALVEDVRAPSSRPRSGRRAASGEVEPAGAGERSADPHRHQHRLRLRPSTPRRSRPSSASLRDVLVAGAARGVRRASTRRPRATSTTGRTSSPARPAAASRRRPATPSTARRATSSPGTSPGLVIPYYVGAGDFAAAFVLAHEFGHAMQARLPAARAADDPVRAAGRLLRGRVVALRAGAGPARAGRPRRGDARRLLGPRPAGHRLHRPGARTAPASSAPAPSPTGTRTGPAPATRRRRADWLVGSA